MNQNSASASSSLRVLLLAKDYPPTPGGVETYSEEVARALAEAGHTVTVLTQQPTSTDDTMDAVGVRVLRVPRGSQLRVALAMTKALRRLHRDGGFDLVHATTWRVALPVLALRVSTPLGLTVHGREVVNYPRALRPLLQQVLRRAARIVAVSPATARLVTEEFPACASRVIVRWNGISFPELARSARRAEPVPGPLRVLTLARLVPRKNVDKCLRALAELAGDGVEVHYTVAGKGPELERLQEMAAQLLPAGTVDFAGYVPDADLPGLYAEHDVFLHPHSHAVDANEFEGFGIVIADAMSFGCVVVAGRDGGPGDFVTDGETGFSVDGDDPSSIARALRTIIEDPELRARLSGGGRDFALAHFSWRAHAEGLSTP